MKLKFIVALLIIGMLLCVSTQKSLATESGGQASANGPEGSGGGMLPPPGFYLLNYTEYMHSERFNNSDGDSAVPGFKMKGIANIVRGVYTSKVNLLGGNLGAQVIVPLVHLDLKTPGGSQSKTGLGDVEVGVFNSWHFKNIHIALGPELFLPVGSYDKKDIANIGRNYYTIEPVFAITYLADNGFDVSSKFMYDINTENTDTNYKSGQEFHFDYFVGRHVKNWTVGLNGYFYKQLTDDKVDGKKVGDGNKGQAMGLGPEVAYQYKNMSFSAKYHKEFEVENKPVTERFWLKFVYAF